MVFQNPFMEFMSERVIDHEDLRLNLAESKDTGPALLFLHGVARQWRSFSRFMLSFAEEFQLYALDFRGHGLSCRAPGNYLVKDYVADANAILMTAIPDGAIVYGHSLGAMVAAAVAADQPQKVRALILEDPPFATMGREIQGTAIHAYLLGLKPLAGSCVGVDEACAEIAEIRIPAAGGGIPIRLGDTRNRDSIRFTAGSVLMMDPAVLDPVLDGRWLEGYCEEEIFGRIHCPTFVLQADVHAGGMLTDADLLRICFRIANCTTTRLSGVDHLMHWTDPDSVTRAVRGFLKSAGVPLTDRPNHDRRSHENG